MNTENIKDSAVSKIYETMDKLPADLFVEFLRENKETLLKLESYIISEQVVKAQMELISNKNN
jgi:hypothetical protein